MKLKEAFELTNSNIDKKSFERLKDYNLSSYKEKQILSQHLNKKGVQVEPFMFFENKRLKNNKSDFQQIKADVIQHLKALKNDSFVVLEKDKNGDYYAIHQRFHQIHSLQSLIGSEAYQNFISQQEKSTDKAKVITINDNTSGTGSDTDINHRESVNVSEVLKVALKSTENALKTLLSSGAPVGRDNTENELKKRRKKK